VLVRLLYYFLYPPGFTVIKKTVKLFIAVVRDTKKVMYFKKTTTIPVFTVVVILHSPGLVAESVIYRKITTTSKILKYTIFCSV